MDSDRLSVTSDGRSSSSGTSWIFQANISGGQCPVPAWIRVDLDQRLRAPQNVSVLVERSCGQERFERYTDERADDKRFQVIDLIDVPDPTTWAQ